MQTCVIFNPTARGDKARHFQAQLGELGAKCVLKPTTGAGTARTIAAQAVAEGFATIVAAGGDGTVNEVLNGIGDARGFAKARLGIIPLGTVNVFAKELRLPSSISKNWQLIVQGHETAIDLPYAEFEAKGHPEKRYFAQLAGAGLDARAIELMNWELKKKAGPAAYVWAGIQALRQKVAPVEVSIGSRIERGELVLVGNGRFYGGRLGLFPNADLRDGLLHVCIFPRVNITAMARCGWGLLTNNMLKSGGAIHVSAPEFTLRSADRTPLEFDGDNVGHLPARFAMDQEKLRVIVW